VDSEADAKRVDQTYRLLALCARAEGHAVFYEQLRAQLAAFTAWESLAPQAELHGMAALLWHHLRQAKLTIPAEPNQTLTGLYLRQRAANRVHTQVLLETYGLLEAEHIVPLVLKGLALAHQYYPDPTLRAVSDIDLLLQPSEVQRAVQALVRAGFTLEGPALDPAALPPAEVRLHPPATHGFRTPLELHHGHAGRWPLSGPFRDDELAGLGAAPQSLVVSGRELRMPAPAEALGYLSRHFQRHLFEASANRPLPLKWVADIISLVERHAAEPGWSERLRDDRILMQRLEVFYSLTPLPQELARIIPIRPSAPPSGVNRYPGGWPRQHRRSVPHVGPIRFLLSSLAPPSSWWLRLHYGISQRSCWWHAAVIHPAFVLRLASRGLLRRILRRTRRSR
jgi:hypothetical protein